MRNYLLFLFFFISTLAYSQYVETKILFDKDWNITNDTNNYVYYRIVYIDEKGNIKNNEVKDFYKNGVLQMQGYYTKIKLNDNDNEVIGDGKFIFYDKDGFVSSEYTTINGRKNGEQIIYYSNTHKIYKKSIFENDKKISEQIFANDQLVREINYENDKQIPTSEKWMLLYNNNPIFTFNFTGEKVVVRNNNNNKSIILNMVSENSFYGNESLNNSIFLDETYRQNRRTYYSFSYLSRYKMKMFFKQTFTDFIGFSENKQEYILVKDLKNENQQSISDLEKIGIVYRTEFKNGKIGEDYVPEITSLYNAGRTYNIDGVSIQEEDYRTKVDDGGYTNVINGYTAIYQLINKSQKNYLINFTINGTSKMTDIVKNKKWFSYDKYNTEVTYSDFDFTKTIVLKPNESLKDQLIVGIEIPINYALIVNEIKEVSNEWVLNLNNSISGTNLLMSTEFLNDNLAKKYFDKKISENISKLYQKQILSYTENNKKFISITIKPKDEALFDKDFQSEVETKIVNNSLIKLKIIYETPFGTKEVIVGSKKSEIISDSIKGIDKTNLTAKILTIEKID